MKAYIKTSIHFELRRAQAPTANVVNVSINTIMNLKRWRAQDYIEKIIGLQLWSAQIQEMNCLNAFIRKFIDLKFCKAQGHTT